MTETLRPARGGWQQEEVDLLWKEVRAAADSGVPLRQVFEQMGRTLGRKPNSVRNYYYMQLRDQAGEELRRAAPFETFSEDEVHELLRRVLVARGEGRSVRSCVMDLSHGDRALMLRYQNKYRAVLRKKPDLIASVCRELTQEGLPCPTAAACAAPVPQLSDADDGDPDVQAILRAVQSLCRRARTPMATESDRWRVQRDLMLMQLEDLQSAARALIGECKEFLGEAPEEREGHLSDFCAALTERIACLESVSG